MKKVIQFSFLGVALAFFSCEPPERSEIIVFINGEKGVEDRTYQTCSAFRNAYSNGWRPNGWDKSWTLTGCTENNGLDGVTFFYTDGNSVIFNEINNE